jgi:hypothetical protein
MRVSLEPLASERIQAAKKWAMPYRRHRSSSAYAPFQGPVI